MEPEFLPIFVIIYIIYANSIQFQPFLSYQGFLGFEVLQKYVITLVPLDGLLLIRPNDLRKKENRIGARLNTLRLISLAQTQFEMHDNDYLGA